MGQRVIPVAVTAEYIGGDGVTLGAAGSHNSVLIEYDFRSAGPQWDDISGRYVLWTNPQGNSTNRINLGVNEKVEGYEGVYQAAPPADAMCVPGWAEMVVVGFTLDGDKEITKIKTEPSRFRVLPGSSRSADNEGIAPTVADQLQAEIEAINNNLTEDIEDLQDKKVNKPADGHDPNGNPGQVLKSLGKGKTQWADPNIATDEQVEAVLRQHPEWSTTVQDGSLTEGKLTPEQLMSYLPVEPVKTTYTNHTIYGDRQTIVHYAIIPSEYRPELTLANDTIDSLELATENACRHHSTITTNAGIFSDGQQTGIVVVDGVVRRGNDQTEHTKTSDFAVLYMTEDGELHSVRSRKTTAEIMELAPVWAVQGWYPIIENGEFVGSGHVSDDYNPLTFIGQDYDGNYLIAVCEGRNPDSLGMSMHDAKAFVEQIGFDAKFLYNLDGGGSSTFVYHGIRVNKLTRGENRKVSSFITFRKNDVRIVDPFKTAREAERQLENIRADYIHKNRMSWYGLGQNYFMGVDFKAVIPQEGASSNWTAFEKKAAIGYDQSGNTVEVHFVRDNNGVKTEQAVVKIRENGYVFINGALVVSAPADVGAEFSNNIGAESELQYAFLSGNMIYISARIVVDDTIQRYGKIIQGLPYIGYPMNPRYPLYNSEGAVHLVYATRYKVDPEDESSATRTAICAEQNIPAGTYWLNVALPVSVGQ